MSGLLFLEPWRAAGFWGGMLTGGQCLALREGVITYTLWHWAKEATVPPVHSSMWEADVVITSPRTNAHDNSDFVPAVSRWVLDPDLLVKTQPG